MPPTIPVSRAEQSTGCVILIVIHDPVWEVVVVTGLPILSAQDSILHEPAAAWSSHFQSQGGIGSNKSHLFRLFVTLKTFS